MDDLLDAGAEPSTLELKSAGHGWAAIHYATHDCNTMRIDWLHNRGASTNVKNEQGQTALMMAARMGDIHEAITLLKCGALLDVQDKLGRTALFHAAEGGGKEMVHFLLEAGADKLIENNAGLNPAQQAMLNNPPWPGTASLLQVFRFVWAKVCLLYFFLAIHLITYVSTISGSRSDLCLRV